MKLKLERWIARRHEDKKRPERPTAIEHLSFRNADVSFCGRLLGPTNWDSLPEDSSRPEGCSECGACAAVGRGLHD